MAPTIRIAAASLNQTPLDWKGNSMRIVRAIEKAISLEADILCLPELCLTGYGCEDLFLSEAFCEQAWKTLHSVLPHTTGIIVTIGLPICFESAIYNAIAIVANGKIHALIPKQNLADDGIHYEPRWFKPWPRNRQTRYAQSDESIPCGDYLIEIHRENRPLIFGIEICEDAWVKDRPAASLAKRGAMMILNPSASHFAFGKVRIRESIVTRSSESFAPTYVYANLLGNEAGRAIYDGDLYIAHQGRIITAAPRLKFTDSEMIAADIPISASDATPDHDRVFIPLPITKNKCSLPTQPSPQSHHLSKEQEFARAVALGLWDYLRKTQSQGAVISLSGGADSAAVATLSALALRMAYADLGESGFRDRLRHLRHLPAILTPETVAPHFITCVYQSTRNSSATTLEAARAVAEGIHAKFLVWNIDPIVEQYHALIESDLGRRLSWQEDDIALQNIQARARSPGVWMLANIENKLLLATSNRSEAAVGYATMDGDTSGGLAPIAGIDKAYLRQWLQIMDSEGLPPLIAPLSFLRLINKQAPTAELRPAASHQTDEADLMPYPILDAIERAAIVQKLSPLMIAETLSPRFPNIPPSTLHHYIRRFFTLWSRNQWKRERFAPSFHLDEHNLDPRTWCRFPILNGAYISELEELSRISENSGPPCKPS
jgi:NAD+ synthase (glutamine-hydrolysing)